MIAAFADFLHPVDFLERKANELAAKQGPAAATAGGNAAGEKIAVAIEASAVVVVTVGVLTAITLYCLAHRKKERR